MLSSGTQEPRAADEFQGTTVLGVIPGTGIIIPGMCTKKLKKK